MGWQDREYSTQHPWERWDAEHGSGRGRGPQISGPARTAVVLMVVHVAAWLLMLMFHADKTSIEIAQRFGFTKDHLYPQAILLHPYATTSPFSLFIDILVLWTLGSTVAQRCGALRTVSWYVAGNLAAGLTYFGLAMADSRLALRELEAPLGAFSAWIFALYRLWGDEFVMLLGTMRRLGTILLIGFGAYVLLSFAFFQVGGLAMLAASVAGFAGMPIGGMLAELLGRIPWTTPRERDVSLRVRPSAPPPRRAAALPRESVDAGAVERRSVRTVAHADERDDRPASAPPESDIDDLLAKISREGLAALTDEERERLELARQARLRKS